MSDYFSDLDSLLHESLTEKAERKQAKVKNPSTPVPSRRPKPKGDPIRPANGQWMNASEVSEYQRQVKIAEAKGLWKPQAAVAMFATQMCLSCGHQHTHFEGFFIHQLHAHSQTERWIRATDTPSISGLPRFRKTTLHESDACTDCIGQQGFTDPSQTLSEPSYASWSPRKNNQVYSAQLEYPGGFSRPSETSSVE